MGGCEGLARQTVIDDHDCPAGRPRQVAAVKYIRSMRGESCSHMLLGEDGALYVTKFTDNPQHARLLANEWLASHLAELVGLPVAKRSVVSVSPAFVRDNPELAYCKAGVSTKYSPGLHYGSQLVGTLLPKYAAYDYLPSPLLSKVINIEDFMGALIFDRWVCNVDCRQAVFLRRRGAQEYAATFIDHGMCFSADSWDLKMAVRSGCYGNRAVYAGIKGLCVFEIWLERIERISIDSIWAGFASMPSVWYAGYSSEANALVERLAVRRECLMDTLLALRAAHPRLFPLWE
jgi:hypothetical protein